MHYITVFLLLSSSKYTMLVFVFLFFYLVSGQPYNCNADTAAGAIAIALKAESLLLLTDVKVSVLYKLHPFSLSTCLPSYHSYPPPDLLGII